MQLKSFFYLFIFLFCCIKMYAQNDSVFSKNKISTIELLNLKDEKSSHILEDKKPCLFIFLSPDCPLCQNYSATLNSMESKYGNDITFYGIIPGKTYSKKELQAFQAAYKINYSLFIDQQIKLSKYLGATVTPQVILLDKNKILVYKGAIDDLLQKLGKQKLKATTFYLKEAVENTLQQKPVDIKRTVAVGCKLNEY